MDEHPIWTATKMMVSNTKKGREGEEEKKSKEKKKKEPHLTNAGYDDVIYPVDYRTAGHIVDDDMHAIMVRPLRPGVRLTAIFDSCHSGTALDLPYVYSTQGVLKEPNLAKEAAQDLFSAITSYGNGDLSSMAETAIGFFKKAAIGSSARERTVMTKTSPADVVMFSGSKDTQTSADTFQDGEARGALSWAFIKSLERWPYQSYLQLLNTIRSELEDRYTQKPQLSSSHPLGESRPGHGPFPVTLASRDSDRINRYQFAIHHVADRLVRASKFILFFF